MFTSFPTTFSYQWEAISGFLSQAIVSWKRINFSKSLGVISLTSTLFISSVKLLGFLAGRESNVPYLNDFSLPVLGDIKVRVVKLVTINARLIKKYFALNSLLTYYSICFVFYDGLFP